jgi:hypothetical protein
LEYGWACFGARPCGNTDLNRVFLTFSVIRRRVADSPSIVKPTFFKQHKMKYTSLSLLFLCAWLCANMAFGQPDCATTNHGLTPIPDLGTGTYLGYQGGLYPGGENTKPPVYLAKALNQVSKLKPRLADGTEDCENGRIVLMSIGGSNPASEFARFRAQALAYPDLNPKLTIVNTGGLGKIPRVFDPTDEFWTNVSESLAAAGVTVNQVQVIWVQTDNVNDGDTSFPGAPQALTENLIDLCHLIVENFPNTRICHFTARAYAGFAAPDFEQPALEYPRDYYNGWAIKWLIERQIAGDPALKFTGADRNSPFLAWATYLWSDGETPCLYSDLSWDCPTDFKPIDGFHYSVAGKTKAGQQLFDFFSTDEVAQTWFLDSYSCANARPAPGSVTRNMPDQETAYVYPNPIGSAVQIGDIQADQYDVYLHDLYGRLVSQCRNCTQINTENLASGMYQISVSSGDRLLLRQKLCK